MYHVMHYYTNEIIAITADLQIAMETAQKTDYAVVTDENNRILYYCNLDIPF